MLGGSNDAFQLSRRCSRAPLLLCNPSRLLKKAHLRRPTFGGYPTPRAALRRTSKYASHLSSRAALHLDLFEQPERIAILYFSLPDDRHARQTHQILLTPTQKRLA